MIDFDLSHLQIRSWSLFIGSTISDHVETVPVRIRICLYLFSISLEDDWSVPMVHFWRVLKVHT